MDAAWLGLARLGEFKLGAGPTVYDRTPEFHCEIRSIGGGHSLYYIPKNILGGQYEDRANACGTLDLELPPDDKAWDYVQYGREVWLYRHGQLIRIYVIKGITQSR